MSFGQRLRTLRQERNMTQQEFADAFKISRSAVAGYETSGKEPDNERLLKIADFFGVSVDYLIGATDDRTSSTSKAAPTLAVQIAELIAANASVLKVVQELDGLSESQLNRIVGYIQAVKEIPDNSDNIKILEKNA